MRRLNTRVGEQIRIYRKNRNLTQELLGERVDLPQSYIGAIERGERNISLDTLERIMDALGVKPEELFGSARFDSDGAKEKLIDKIIVSLRKRNTKELSLIYNLINDLVRIIEEK